jgi:hypothetical protein
MSSEPSQQPRPVVEGAPASPPAIEVAVTDAVAGGHGSPVGRFRYDVAARSWWFSERLHALYGFGRDDVVTTDLLRPHQRDDHGARTAVDLVPFPGPDGVFSRRCRIRDARGVARTLVLVGQAQRGEHQQMVAVLGYVADVTAAVRSATARETSEAVERSALTRAVIEQAKGVVMAIRRTSADDAFELLRWHSQHANIKLRDLATLIVDQVPRSAKEGHEATLDRVLAEVLRRGAATSSSRIPAAAGGRNPSARRPAEAARVCEHEGVPGVCRREGGGGGEREGDDPHPARHPGQP